MVIHDSNNSSFEIGVDGNGSAYANAFASNSGGLNAKDMVFLVETADGFTATKTQPSGDNQSLYIGVAMENIQNNHIGRVQIAGYALDTTQLSGIGVVAEDDYVELTNSSITSNSSAVPRTVFAKNLKAVVASDTKMDLFLMGRLIYS